MSAENTKGAGGEKQEPVTVTPSQFGEFLLVYVRAVAERMVKVRAHEVSADDAAAADDLLARKLAVTLMGENPEIRLMVPYRGTALIAVLQKNFPGEFARGRLPESIDRDNPRAVMTYVGRSFFRGIYALMRRLGAEEGISPEKASAEMRAYAEHWARRFMGIGEGALN
ncbi:MAG: hypothetical protein ACFWTZ_01800 [Burkholderia sp.]|jgi:hypothetical protein